MGTCASVVPQNDMNWMDEPHLRELSLLLGWYLFILFHPFGHPFVLTDNSLTHTSLEAYVVPSTEDPSPF